MLLKVDSGECARISLLSLFCSLSVLVLGLALQISHGFFQRKALAAVTACIVLCAVALALPRVTLLLPFRRQAMLRRSFFVLLAAYFALGIAFLRIRHLPIDVLILENDSVHALLHGIDPEIYEALEERDVKYAIRLPANDNLLRDIEELLTRRWGGPVTSRWSGTRAFCIRPRVGRSHDE
jgi:hypothetical protein